MRQKKGCLRQAFTWLYPAK